MGIPPGVLNEPGTGTTYDCIGSRDRQKGEKKNYCGQQQATCYLEVILAVKDIRGEQGGPRLSEILYIYDPPIYNITSGCTVAALFSREEQRWMPDAIWFPRYFYLQANGIMYLECRE